MRMPFLIIVCLFFATISVAQNAELWKNAVPNELAPMQKANQEFDRINEHVIRLDQAKLKEALHDVPMEFTAKAKSSPRFLDLPMPNGTMTTFRIVESPVMAAGLAIKFPSIKTYSGVSVDKPSTRVRFSNTVNGLSAIIHSTSGSALIVPYAEGSTDYYTSFYQKDILVDPSQADSDTHFCSIHQFEPDAIDIPDLIEPSNTITGQKSVIQNLSVYSIALATTGNFYISRGNNDNAVLGALATIVNNLNSIYEIDAAARYELIAENDLLLFSDPQTDGYTNGDAGSLLSENTNNVNNALLSVGGASSYDVSQVFGTNTGGVASLGSVCTNRKAQASSSTFGAFSGALFFHIVGHELGHQMSANHTFNFCGGQENPSTGFEPASGSTIMSYAGAGCQAWIQPSSDPNFHHNSIETMRLFADNTSCQTLMSTSNNTPIAEIPMEDDFYIPISTPFELTGVGTDQDGDQVTYSWEQSDIGPATPLGTQASLDAPLFRTFPPTDSPTRVFPRMDKVLNDDFDATEVLPNYSRNLSFILLVRDNSMEAGAIDMATIEFQATEQAGPFLVMYPNAGTDSLEAGRYTEFMWDVANTDGTLVDCQTVDIFLSIDNGENFDIVLAEGVPNTGSAFVTIPDVETNLARIKIKGGDNIFFDVSDNRHVITPPSQPGYGLTLTNTTQEICLPDDVVVGLNTISLLEYDSLVTFDIISGLPPGAVANFSSNPIVPSENATLTFDMENVSQQDMFEVVLRAVAGGSDTLYRSIFISTIENDFSSMTLVFPADGESNIVGGPEFIWNTAAVADFYEIEIATTPVFAPEDIVYNVSNLLEPSFTPPTVLDENTLYYWRVRGTNQCGDGDFTFPSAFHTEAVSCETFVSNDVPRNISSSGTPSIESSLAVVTGGLIRDINIPKIKGSHDQVRHLDGILRSPIGTEVLLFSNMCPGSNAAPFDLGFDDEAPTNITCPPSSGFVHIPTESLSAFDGENSAGTWVLNLKVVNNDGEGGGLEDWQLEICGSLDITNPTVIENVTMPVRPLDERLIDNNFLLVTDDATPSALRFTIVTNTQNGTILLNETQELKVGDTFTQSDINNLRLRYAHQVDGTTSDSFRFTVVDGDGGWIGTPTFNIVTDADAVYTGVEDIGNADAISIYPNPTAGLFNIEFNNLSFRDMEVDVFDIQGRLMNHTKFTNPDSRVTINANDLASGIYFVKIKSENIIYTKKLSISK